jgi:hypothetical protein
LVVWNMMFFSIQLGMSSSQLTNSIIFQRGRSTTNQIMWSNVWDLTHSHLLMFSTYHTSTGCFFSHMLMTYGTHDVSPFSWLQGLHFFKGVLQVSSRNGYFLQNRHMNSDDFHHGNSWDWVRCSAQKIPKVVLACQSTSAYRESPRGPKDPKIPMIHGIVPCEAQIRPRAFPAARIRKRRPSATASKNARRPRRCRSCWRTTNELLVLYIYIIILYKIYIYYYIYIRYLYIL